MENENSSGNINNINNEVEIPTKGLVQILKLNYQYPYNKVLFKDNAFKQFYQENLYKAVFTFPKFKRNYSKNYKNVQLSFKKVSKSKPHHKFNS